MMDSLPINWTLLSNPFNWAVVFLMVAIPTVALTVIRNSLAPST